MESFQPRRSARLAAKAVAESKALPFKPRTPLTRARAALSRQVVGFGAKLKDDNVAVRRQGFIASIHFVCDHPAIVKAECPRLIEGLKRKIAAEPALRAIPDVWAAIERFEVMAL
jgi:hypothetical protein